MRIVASYASAERCSGETPYFFVNADTNATATFATLFDVAASATGPGSVSLDPPGGGYAAGAAVTVTATPEHDAAFRL